MDPIRDYRREAAARRVRDFLDRRDEMAASGGLDPEVIYSLGLRVANPDYPQDMVDLRASDLRLLLGV